MIRTQVSLTADQMRRLRAEARRRDMPIAAVVREAIDRVVPDERGTRRKHFQRALRAAGRFRSGTGDVSTRHDDIAGEADW
jgi:hypothetical protein